MLGRQALRKNRNVLVYVVLRKAGSTTYVQLTNNINGYRCMHTGKNMQRTGQHEHRPNDIPAMSKVHTAPWKANGTTRTLLGGQPPRKKRLKRQRRAECLPCHNADERLGVGVGEGVCACA